MSSSSLPVGVCVKVDELRPKYDNLAEYRANTRNVLVCRRGRVWITNKTKKTKTLYHWESSPWANPFPVKQYGLVGSLDRYRAYLDELLRDPTKQTEFEKLRDAETIGCFCGKNEPCHRDIILGRLKSTPVLNKAD